MEQLVLGALVGLARAVDSGVAPTEETFRLMVEGLRHPEDETLLAQAHAHKAELVPDCMTCASPCGRTADYDMSELEQAAPELRDAKQQLVAGLRALVSGPMDTEIEDFLLEALFRLGYDYEAASLQPFLVRLEDIRRRHTGA